MDVVYPMRRKKSVVKKNKLHIVITAGPTREYFDSVRFITNASSGKMGYAVARAAAVRGHTVTLISGPVHLPPPADVRTIQVVTAAKMAAAAKRIFPRADVAILTAAVCDYRPAERSKKKLKKSAEPEATTLVPTEDIAASLGKHKKARQLTVCFALEDHQGREFAEQKLERKNADAIVLNGVHVLGSDAAGGVEFLVRGGTWRRWKTASKEAIADQLINEIEQMAATRGDHL